MFPGLRDNSVTVFEKETDPKLLLMLLQKEIRPGRHDGDVINLPQQ